MVAIFRDAIGRYVVADERRVHGCYRTAAMAARRVEQLAASWMPRKTPAKG